MGDILLMVALLLLMTGLGVWVGLLIAAEDERRRCARSACDPDKETPPEGWAVSAFAQGMRCRRWMEAMRANRIPITSDSTENPYDPGTMDSVEWARGWEMAAKP